MTHQKTDSRALVTNLPGWVPAAVDFGLILLAFLLGHYARYELQLLRPLDEAFRAPFDPFVAYALIFAAWLTISLQQHNMYRYVRERSWIAECLTIANTGTNALVVVMALSFFLQPLVFSRLLLLYGAIFSMVLLSLMRLVYRNLRERQRRRGIGVARVLVVGAGEVGLAVMRNILARSELGFQVVGFVDDDPERGGADIGRLRALGSLDSLHEVIIEERIELVIITLSWESHRSILTIVQECARQAIQVRIVPDLFQLQLNRMQIENLAGIPLLGVKDGVRISHTERLLKRLLDISLVVLGAPVWVVVFALIALAIRLEGPGPILYGQERVGKDGRRFMAWKFRSMVQNAEEMKAQLVAEQGLDPRHPKVKNDPRVTRVGGIIRRTSIDELPQIINVLRGEMSLVGPRPPTPDEVALYEPWHRQRLAIRGGLTGLWQVSGRSDVPFEEMVLLDLYYIENWSLLLDLQILLRTIPRVLFAEGAY
jgi:exopolysaccharide biosynthesis polyprenyl glycosylphosphotransferase